MKSFYRVTVRCNEDGHDVESGSFSGVASSVEEAMTKAVTMAKKGGLKSETNHRVTSVYEIGRVQFGLGKK